MQCTSLPYLMFPFPTGRHSLIVYNCRGSRNDGDLQEASPAAELLLIIEAARTGTLVSVRPRLACLSGPPALEAGAS